MTTTHTPRIAIIGAGPGGLTCARILQQHGIGATVYDHEAGPDMRNQGGTLDLHEDNGQIALREAGLLEDFFRLSRPEGQEMRQMDPAGTVLLHHTPEEGESFKPEIDRGQLRDLLLNSLRPGTVRWSHTLSSVEGPAAGPRQLYFAAGTTIEADLVIGADGAWSKVRRAISDATPRYTGISFLEAWFHDADNEHPEIAELVGQGSASAADGERGLFAQRSSGGHIRVYIMQRVPADWIAAAGLTVQDTDGIRALLPGPLPRLVTDPAPADHRQRRPLRRPPHLRPARPPHWEHNPRSPCWETPPTSCPRSASASISPCWTPANSPSPS